MFDVNKIVRCPTCSGKLDQTNAGLFCNTCDTKYPIVNNVVCFAETDPFYDQYAVDECPFALTPKGIIALILKIFPFWSYREWRFWRQVIPKGGKLLDIGAGRGKEIFLERADTMVGIDGSLTFLKDCLDNYDAAVLASLPKLPFDDETFDVVASSHVIGHIPVEDKDALIAEMARVLKPGGITAHIIETDSESETMKATKHNADFYKHLIVDQDGHIGLELADDILDRFRRGGFKVRVMRMVDAIVPSAHYYGKYLQHDEFGELPGIGWSRRLKHLNESSYLGNLMYEFGFGAFHRTIEQWFGKPNHANFIHVSFEKI